MTNLTTAAIRLSNLEAPIRTSWERIDSEQALLYLGTVKKNRRVYQAKVNQYARAMKSGRWRETAGDSLRFDTNGVLMDGQHRMWAVLEADGEIVFRVDRGLPPEDLYVIDTGRVRTLANFLQIDGEINAVLLGSSITLLMAYEQTGICARSTLGILSSIQESMDFFHDHAPNIRSSVKLADPIRRLFRGGSKWAVLHYTFVNIDPKDTEDFFQKLKSGENLAVGDPIFALRRKLLDNVARPPSQGLPEMEYCALVIKAWNAYREGREVKMLVWHGGGASPQPFPKPV